MNITDYIQSPTFYISQAHGCVYSLIHDDDSDGDYLIYTPLNADDTFTLNDDDWTEVDDMALLGEEQHIQDEVAHVYDVLSQ